MGRTRFRYAPDDWQPGITNVKYVADDGTGLVGATGRFIGNSMPEPGITPKSWLGVLIQFEGEESPLDVDPADLESTA